MELRHDYALLALAPPVACDVSTNAGLPVANLARGKRGKGLPRFYGMPNRARSAGCLLTLVSHEPLLLQRCQHLVQAGG